MNTEDRIPAPRIQHPAKANLYRKPPTPTWLKLSIAACGILCVGLGYFFSQWSAPPAEVQLPIVALEETLPVTNKTEPIADPAEEIPVEIEQTPVHPQTRRKVIEKVVSNDIKPEELQIAEYNPIPVIIVEPVTELAVAKADVPEVDHIEIEIIELSKPTSSFEQFKGGDGEYGQEIAERVKAIPQTFVAIAQSYIKPFRKSENKKK